MRVRNIWHKEDQDICCLFNAICSVPGTQKMLHKYVVNELKVNEVRSVKGRRGSGQSHLLGSQGLAIRDTIAKKCVPQGEMPGRECEACERSPTLPMELVHISMEN